MKLSHADYRATCNEAFTVKISDPSVFWNQTDGFYVAPSAQLVPNTDLCVGLAYYSRPAYSYPAYSYPGPAYSYSGPAYTYPGPAYAYPGPAVAPSAGYVEQGYSQAAPPQVQHSQPQGDWYFCADSNAYYPYVRECPEGWQRVPSTPPR